MPFPVLLTERLVLREINEKDYLDIFQYLSDREVMKYYGMMPFQKEEEALEEIKWYQQIYHSQSGIRWGISLQGSSQIIGSCGFLNWDKKHHRVEIGFELSKEYWKLGMMTEALSKIIPFGFENYRFNRIQALVEPDNRASHVLLKKLGFVEEGVLSQYEFTCGKYDDLLMLALLKRDFI
ncbi:GNAT family N-acetyltransferase [Risungbinella massiliensis]|uniref:GNAT family N-acetyltransferase n=1 Tax=Risungbinella massiliensis TaxID=1329796 RepID=UPI0005CC03CC|nr:GNAT family protein [Risungbinella massiliensis]